MEQNNARGTKNLGLMKAIYVGVNPPLNTKILWYNDNTEPYTTGPPKVHYYYNVINSRWEPLYTNGSGNFGYMAYASDCEAGDFSLVFDENLHTHWSLFISAVETQAVGLIPSLFENRWTKFCDENESNSGNFTYIGYAEDCDGTNFSTEKEYVVECEDCEYIDSAIKSEGNSSISISDIADGFEITFDNVRAGQSMIVDLTLNGQPLQQLTKYCIKAYKDNIAFPVALNMSNTKDGSFFVAPDSEEEEKFIDEADGNSIMFVWIPDTFSGAFSGTMQVKIGTEGCYINEGQICKKQRNCFAIITSEEPIENLTVDLFENKWNCICCSDNKNDDNSNLSKQLYVLDEYVKQDKAEQDQKIDQNTQKSNELEQADVDLEDRITNIINQMKLDYDEQISVLNTTISDLNTAISNQNSRLIELEKVTDQDVINKVTPTIENLIQTYDADTIQPAITNIDDNLNNFINSDYQTDKSKSLDDDANIIDSLDQLTLRVDDLENPPT